MIAHQDLTVRTLWSEASEQKIRVDSKSRLVCLNAVSVAYRGKPLLVICSVDTLGWFSVMLGAEIYGRLLELALTGMVLRPTTALAASNCVTQS